MSTVMSVGCCVIDNLYRYVCNISSKDTQKILVIVTQSKLNRVYVFVQCLDYGQAGQQTKRASVPDRANKFFSPPKHAKRLWVPNFLLFNKYRTLCPGYIRPWLEADYSPLSRAEVKKEWSYTSTPPVTFMLCV